MTLDLVGNDFSAVVNDVDIPDGRNCIGMTWPPHSFLTVRNAFLTVGNAVNTAVLNEKQWSGSKLPPPMTVSDYKMGFLWDDNYCYNTHVKYVFSVGESQPQRANLWSHSHYYLQFCMLFARQTHIKNTLHSSIDSSLSSSVIPFFLIINLRKFVKLWM